MLAAATFDAHSLLVGQNTFEPGTVGPADWHTLVQPLVPSLAVNSMAIDRAELLPNIGDGYQGQAPDLGALEATCDVPLYGVRPPLVDETIESFGCFAGGGGGDGGLGGDDTPGGGGSPGGCGCGTTAPDGSWVLGLFLAGRFARRCRR